MPRKPYEKGSEEEAYFKKQEKDRKAKGDPPFLYKQRYCFKSKHKTAAAARAAGKKQKFHKAQGGGKRPYKVRPIGSVKKGTKRYALYVRCYPA